jgi:Protein of unknown function (DUF2970)
VTSELRSATRRPLSFWQTLRAVAWSFFGVRKGSEYERDAANLNPLYVIIAGLLGAAMFVILLVVLVNWVIGSGVAAS